MRHLLPDRLSARLLLSSGLQLLLVGTALGLLGYATGLREGLERVAIERQLHQLTSLSTALSMRLRAPQTINRENLLAIRQGMMKLDDFNQLGLRFWRQMQLYPVGYINWGSSDGSFLGVERLENGRLVLNQDSARPLGRGRLGVYALGPHGERGPLLEVREGMTTFHQEAWYTDTVKAGRATWSSIYQWEDKPQVVAISYNEPVRDGRGTLLGVIGVDFVLSQLSSWLQQLWTHQRGVALVVEPGGLIVASSNPELALVHAGGTRQRMRIDELANMASAFADLVSRLQRKDAAALQLLRAKLRTSLEASAVAHEIKLPLSQILLSSRLLLEGADADAALGADTRAELNAIASAADRVVTTIEKMRTLLRNVQTNHSRLTLAHVASSALLYMRPALNRAGVQIEREGLEQPCLIDGDSTQLQIALVNLLRNSIEALEQQPPVRHLRISLKQQNNKALLRIEDNGPGFPALPDLREPLQTSRHEGSGLGLFVVSTTLKNHRGGIELGLPSSG